MLIEEAERHYKKTHNVACLVICLNFSLALRIGELVSLRTNDFTDSSVKIDRQEVKTYYVDENNIVVGTGMKFLAIQKQKWGNLNKIKVSHTFNQCGRWDLNPHDIAVTRSLVLLVCQFRHFRLTHATNSILPFTWQLVNTYFQFFYFFLSILSLAAFFNSSRASEKRLEYIPGFPLMRFR